MPGFVANSPDARGQHVTSQGRRFARRSRVNKPAGLTQSSTLCSRGSSHARVEYCALLGCAWLLTYYIVFSWYVRSCPLPGFLRFARLTSDVEGSERLSAFELTYESTRGFQVKACRTR